ncbi:MAG: hypothetical protein ASARMPREDX12_005145 [Alectoria sarmentosa]|nr:MAG: hypothetical protein ASARMPREDX12_005145 [Alectoria sarmentosa]
MNASAVNNVAAIAAALKDVDEKGSTSSKHGSLNLKTAASSRGLESSKYGSSTGDRYPLGGLADNNDNANEEAMDDEESILEGDFEPNENVTTGSKARARRASEGSYLTKGEGKRSGGEVRCEKCGKGYKHSSCLTKHLWEHTPEWTYTSKLLISKHQQVQLLQAASVLVGMNQDAIAVEETTKPSESDHSSASPTASGSSDVREEEYYISSAETTPPPMNDDYAMVEDAYNDRSKRYSGNSSSFSRSYQSAPSFSLPASNNLSHYQQQRGPSSSGVASTDADEDEAGLVAAVASLCSFGNSRSSIVQLPEDVPPVPPVPARYREHNANRLSGSLGQVPELDLSVPSYQRLSDERDMKMGNSHVVYVHEDFDCDDGPISHGRSDEEDDGVFGAMEGVERLPRA